MFQRSVLNTNFPYLDSEWKGVGGGGGGDHGIMTSYCRGKMFY